MTNRKNQAPGIISAGLLVMGLFQSVTPLGAGNKVDAFDLALGKVQVLKIQYGDPTSWQRKVEAYVKLLGDFRKHPRINDAKVYLFHLTTDPSFRSKSSIDLAAQLIGDLLDGADLKTPAGQKIAFLFADFLLDCTSDRDSQDLAKAEKMMKDLIAQSHKEKNRLMELKARQNLGRILIEKKQNVAGVKYLLDTIQLARDWEEDDNFDLYRLTLHNTRAYAGNNLGFSHDPAQAALIREFIKDRWDYDDQRKDPLYFALSEYEEWEKRRLAENPFAGVKEKGAPVQGADQPLASPGEDSRWLPWVALGLAAALILFVAFFWVRRGSR